MARTILIVDDDLELRDIMVAILADPGYTVLTASDGYEALRVLVDRSIDLIITDIRMPGIDGFELARQAKVMRPNLRVMYFSGQDTEDAGLTYGTIIPKPIRANALLEVVQRELGDGAMSQPRR